jgi:ATP-dependent DNA helicase RecQ
VRKFGHERVSTYGIGKDIGRAEWAVIGRELVRLGFLRQDAGRFNVLELTNEGRAVLKERRKIQLTKSMKAPEKQARAVGEIACDESLFETLRRLRKSLADERGVPSYIIFSDVSLRQMARCYPTSRPEFVQISGVGLKKLEEFGAKFMDEIATHLRTHPKQIFADDSFAPRHSFARRR